MITLSVLQDNKQFISILLKSDVSTTAAVLTNLKNKYPVLSDCNIITDTNEILIEVDNNICFGFSLNSFREYIATITTATVTMFCFDFNTNTRIY